MFVAKSEPRNVRSNFELLFLTFNVVEIVSNFSINVNNKSGFPLDSDYSNTTFDNNSVVYFSYLISASFSHGCQGKGIAPPFALHDVSHGMWSMWALNPLNLI